MRLALIHSILFSATLSLSAIAAEMPLVLSDAPERAEKTSPPTKQDAVVAKPTLPSQKLKSSKKSDKELITFSFNEDELENVINFIATKKGYNLLFPTRADDKITGKLTWHLDKKITVDEAWNLLQTIVSMAGYSIVPRITYHEIMRTTPNISREPLPLYIGVPYERLPISDERIRFIHYLANIKPEADKENELVQILKAWLPEPDNQSPLIDNSTNALIITAQSNDIRGIMPLITSLDRPGFQEKMEIITLRYTEAKMVSDLFNSKILGSGTEFNRYRLDTKKPSETTYFSKHLKIIANERRNNLIVLGRSQAIDRVRNFIKNYIDVPPDTGKSILHVYQLQYLDAQEFAKVLKNVLEQKQAGGFEQATGAKQTAIGPQRYFDEVIITTDSPTNGNGGGSGYGGGYGGGYGDEQTTDVSTKYGGGNRLIIACRNDDWKRIETLIGKLDQPSPQVLIEVLIADLTLDDTRALGTALRNPEKIPMAGNTAYQSAHLAPGVMPDSFADPQTIGLIEGIDGTVKAATDLLRTFQTNPDTGVRSDGGTESIASNMAAGSSVISFNDSSGKTWGITQILKLIDHSKILSHPHVISRSDKKAVIEVSETRKLRDAATSSSSTTQITFKDIEAKLQVAITPRIAVSELQDSSVNLQVVIDIDQFKAPTDVDNTRITRNVTTNVTVNNGDILALGGLIRTNEQDGQTQTPILSQIPLIGWMFKRKQKTQQRTNLTVFISPTVIMPRFREGMTTYTKDYLDITRQWAKEGGMFDSLKDPITRWFFTEESPTEKFSKAFLKNDVRFQEVPAPQPKKYVGPTKFKTADSGSQPKNHIQLADASEEDNDQLMQMLKEMDSNPFAELKSEMLAQNKPPEPPVDIPRRKRRRR